MRTRATVHGAPAGVEDAMTNRWYLALVCAVVGLSLTESGTPGANPGSVPQRAGP